MLSNITPIEDLDETDVLRRSDRSEEEIEMTPMVDVTFLLLIFFMVTASFNLQKSIAMPRQQTDLPGRPQEVEPPEDLEVAEVEIDEFGSFLVTTADWERHVLGKQSLTTTFKQAVEEYDFEVRLIVKVHEMAKLSALVDALDAGTTAGFAELEVQQIEPWDRS